eukprot:130617-Rhodomonas_salina.2
MLCDARYSDAACYAVPGTDTAVLPQQVACMCCLVLTQRAMVPGYGQYCPAGVEVSYARSMRCPVLRSGMLLPGEAGHRCRALVPRGRFEPYLVPPWPTACPVLTPLLVLCSSYPPTRRLRHVRY